VECGVDLARFNPADIYPTPYATPGAKIVFTGNMDYWPNADAAIWFANEAMPLLRGRQPAAEFWVVGANPGPGVRDLAKLPGVRVTGRVEDVRPYLAHASLAVCPLRIARGIQNKVLEAMAMGKPVIASPPAFEGVRARAGCDLLVAEGAAAFADQIEDVLSGQHPQLGQRARQAMEQGYAWSKVLQPLDTYLEACDTQR
jgi:sugar transferase (PEP-CTERM/EpsH1 system associated)